MSEAQHTKFIHIYLVYLQRSIEKKIHPRRCPRHSTHITKKTPGTREDTAEIEIKAKTKLYFAFKTDIYAHC